MSFGSKTAGLSKFNGVLSVGAALLYAGGGALGTGADAELGILVGN